MAMVLSSMGTVAFADVVNTTPVSVATEAELKEQLALNTAEIVLAKDITITSAITTSAVSSTIDLNGNNLKTHFPRIASIGTSPRSEERESLL